MTAISKTELADRLGVSGPRISQYIVQGLPVLASGQIDLQAGLRWVKANTLGPAGERAGVLLREVDGADAENPVTRATDIAMGVMLTTIPGVAAAAAREAGCTPELVAKIAAIAYGRAIDAANTVNEIHLGNPPRKTWPTLEFCLRVTAL